MDPNGSYHALRQVLPLNCPFRYKLTGAAVGAMCLDDVTRGLSNNLNEAHLKHCFPCWRDAHGGCNRNNKRALRRMYLRWMVSRFPSMNNPARIGKFTYGVKLNGTLKQPEFCMRFFDDDRETGCLWSDDLHEWTGWASPQRGVVWKLQPIIGVQAAIHNMLQQIQLADSFGEGILDIS